jgi:branched-subunit amino acid ABC-type transport system permease component
MSLGINQSRFRLVMYIFAAIIAGAIGILFGFNSALTPTMGFNLVAMAFMALLVGGASDLRGVIVASFLVSVIPELIVGLAGGVSASWRLPIVFLIAVISLLIRPEGLFSKRKRLS